MDQRSDALSYSPARSSLPQASSPRLACSRSRSLAKTDRTQREEGRRVVPARPVPRKRRVHYTKQFKERAVTMALSKPLSARIKPTCSDLKDMGYIVEPVWGTTPPRSTPLTLLTPPSPLQHQHRSSYENGSGLLRERSDNRHRRRCLRARTRKARSSRSSCRRCRCVLRARAHRARSSFVPFVPVVPLFPRPLPIHPPTAPLATSLGWGQVAAAAPLCCYPFASAFPVAVATLATPAVEREIVACTALASMPGCG